MTSDKTTAGDTPIDARYRSYHEMEYKELRAEQLQIQAQTYSVIRFALVGCLAIYAWSSVNLFASTSTGEICTRFSANLVLFIWMLPVLTAIVGWLISHLSIISLTTTGRYLERLDEKFGAPDLGWHKQGRTRVFLRENGRLINFAAWGGIAGIMYLLSQSIVNTSGTLPACK